MQKLFQLFALVFTLTLFGCASSNETNNQLADRMALFDEKAAIQDLIFDTGCTEEGVCKYIGFGSKPCGGHWFYLVFDSSIEEEVTARVETYNLKEDEFNKKYGIVSDCSMALPPDRVECVDGKCTPVFD